VGAVVKAWVTEPEDDPEAEELEAVVAALTVPLLEPAGALVDAQVADVATVMPFARQRSEANLMVSIEYECQVWVRDIERGNTTNLLDHLHCILAQCSRKGC
jgi:hypothetical protein